MPGGARAGIWGGGAVVALSSEARAGMWGDEPGCHRQEVGVKGGGAGEGGLVAGGLWNAGGFFSREGSKSRATFCTTSGVDSDSEAHKHFFLCVIRSIFMPCNLSSLIENNKQRRLGQPSIRQG